MTKAKKGHRKSNANLMAFSLKWWEMMFASSTTIAMRTSANAYSSLVNKGESKRESRKMVEEKGSAMTDSVLNVAKLYQKSMSKAVLDAFVPGQMTGAVWDKQTAQKIQNFWLDLYSSSLLAAIAPFHRASTANAKRLSKLK